MVVKNELFSDERIVELFFARDEAAIRGVDAKYGKYLHTIAVNILSDCEDCEECKNDTYLALWNNIPPDRPSNFKAYIAKIIRNISINRYKEKTRQKRVPSEYTVSLEELAECVPDKNDAESIYDDKLVFTYNFKDGTETITLAEVEAALCSDLTCLALPKSHSNLDGFSFLQEAASTACVPPGADRNILGLEVCIWTL